MKTKAFFSLFLIAVLCALSFTSCEGGPEYTDKTVFGMDGYMTLRLAGGASAEDINAAAERCAYILAKNEKLMSCRDEEAHIYALNNKVDMLLSPARELSEVLSDALVITNLTDGAYNPALGALTDLWNVNGGGPTPSAEAIEEALSFIDYTGLDPSDGKVTRADGVKVDLGGIAKGYTVQEILEYLATTSVSYGVVSMDGNVGVFGEKSDGELFKVGLCDPDNTENVLGYVYIKDGFVSVSGDHQSFFEENGEKYHHIIDPETGCPADSGLRSVAVLTNNGATADALSTALFVMGAERSMELYRSGKATFEAVMITAGGEILLTDGLTEDRFELILDTYTVRSAEDTSVTLADGN